jgi:hypothetical protein
MAESLEQVEEKTSPEDVSVGARSIVDRATTTQGEADNHMKKVCPKQTCSAPTVPNDGISPLILREKTVQPRGKASAAPRNTPARPIHDAGPSNEQILRQMSRE